MTFLLWSTTSSQDAIATAGQQSDCIRPNGVCLKLIFLFDRRLISWLG